MASPGTGQPGTPRCIAAIVGRQGSGKTTLIERLIPLARARGLTVSTIKHTHHHQIELDTPGKDSHRHRMAGAAEVIVASDSGWARLAASASAASLHELLDELRPVDLVLVEGYKQLQWLRRVEVFRGAGMPLALEDPGIAAVAAPEDLDLGDFQRTRLTLSDSDAILDYILNN